MLILYVSLLIFVLVRALPFVVTYVQAGLRR
jgi:hypothetical protein